MLSNTVLDLQLKRLILYLRLNLFHLILGYNVEQHIAKEDLCCFIFV